MDAHRQQIVDQIVARLGAPGERAREFLETAEALVGPMAVALPKSPELVAYALREALTSITGSAGGSRVRQVARDVLAAAEAANVAVADGMVTRAGLFDAIDRLREFVHAPDVHGTRMIRLIESRTGHEPLRLDPDPVAEYQSLVGATTTALHSRAEDSEALVNRVFELLGRLFAPPDVALGDLDRFVAITNPTAQDAVDLASLLVSAAHLRYFGQRASAPGWLEVLRGSPLALPDQRWPGWPVGDLVLSVAAEDPVLAARWLEETVNERPLDQTSAFEFARIAAGIGRSALSVLVNILKQCPTNKSVGAFAHQALESLEVDEAQVEDFTDALLNDLSDEWRTGQVVTILAAGATVENFERRLTLVGHKLRRQERINPGCLSTGLYGVGPLADVLVQSDLLNSVEYLIAGAAAVVRNALTAGAGDAVLQGVEQLPTLVKKRMRAWLLGAPRLGSTTDAITAVTEEIATIAATSDHLEVIDRAWSDDPDAAADAWAVAMGTPPPQAVLELWLVDDARRANLWRLRTWCTALPESVTLPWQPAAEAVAGYPVHGREALSPRMRPIAISGRSPISVADLAALEIDEAADWITAWRPNPSDWFVSARELGRTLTTVVSQNPRDWADALPWVLERLRHPTYIKHLLDGLRDHADAVVGSLNVIADATAIIVGEPWQVEVIGTTGGFDFDESWVPAKAATLSLLEAMAEAGADVATERSDMFELVLTLSHDRSMPSVLGEGHDPLSYAMNRPSTMALRTAIVLSWCSVRAGGPAPQGLVVLLDEVIALDGEDGLQARAILADTLDLLRDAVPEWITRHLDQLFGPKAPDALGQRTLELALNRNRVDRWMLEELRDQVFTAATDSVHNSHAHVLIGMLNEVDGYSVEEVVDWLVAQDPKLISDVLGTLGDRLRNEESHSMLIRGVELVDGLTTHGVSADAMEGLGRWHAISGLDDRLWTRLMFDAVRRGTALQSAGNVARRAARSYTTDSHLLLQTLLDSAADPWIANTIADAALQALGAHPGQSREREALCATLLDRGYFQARDL